MGASWLMKPRKRYEVQNPSEPNLLREIFPYSEVPRIKFDGVIVPIDPPEEIWITDTTFRDGQQARPPFTVKQMVDLYDLMHRLDGDTGVIRKTEFFLYSRRDREAVEKCLERGYKYPKVTGWIRAVKKDFELVRSMGLEETGILTSCSDYHIYLKLKMDRRKAAEMYCDVVGTALEHLSAVRCHLEDITRADFYGFVIPFCQRLMEIAQQAGKPVIIRMCDTLGYGVPWPEAALPRSVPKIVRALREEAEEIYNIFDTTRILGRPPGVLVTDKSGHAGIALWFNNYLGLEGGKRIPKDHPGVRKIHEEISRQYAEGRVTAISEEEMVELGRKYLPEYFEGR